MTKNNIFLLDGYTSFYTLGALSDDSDEVLTISQTLYDGGTFDIKNLVSKAFDVKSFETSVVFDIKSTRDLKKLTKPVQPYTLKVGSNVRFKNKSYDVIGFYYNQFAQLNIVSPILFNPSSLVSDVSNLFYGLKTNDEVKQIINDNLKAGKYSVDILFPLTVGVKNYKKQLSNIQQPPFTSLDSIALRKVEQNKVGQPLVPYQLDLNQIDFDVFKSSLSTTPFKDDPFYLDIKSFKDLVEKKLEKNEDYNIYSEDYISSHLAISTKENPLLPYNTIKIDNLTALDTMEYDTPIGKLNPIIRYGTVNAERSERQPISDNYFFGISNGANGTSNSAEYYKINSNKTLNYCLFSDPSIKGGMNALEKTSNDFLIAYERSFTNTDIERSIKGLGENCYVLKENTYYGGFFASSGTEKINSDTDEKVLPFGAIFKKAGIYYYVLSYITDEYCLCIKTSSRNKIYPPNFRPYNRTELKGSYKKFTKEEVYKAFKKEGHIFDIDDAFYSLPQTKPIAVKNNKKETTSTVVTDVFLGKRKEQFEVLQSNFPQLGETFLGILSVLDKSLSKPKSEQLIFEKGLVYLVLTNGSGRFVTNGRSYNSEKEDKLKLFSKAIGDLPLAFAKVSITSQKQSDKISQQIIDLAVDTSKIKILNKPFYIGLKSFEDYQKYALSRLVLNLHNNLDLFTEYGGVYYNNIITFPSHNEYGNLSKETFLNTFSSTTISGIRVKDSVNYIFSAKQSYRDMYRIKFKDYESVKKDLLKISQVIFVINALQLLYKNAINVLMAKTNGSLDEYMEGANFIRQLKRCDLSISYSEFIGMVEFIEFTRGNYFVDNSIVERMSDVDKTLFNIFRYEMNFTLSDKDNRENFREIILQLDKLYNKEFNLYDKFINYKSTEILNDFPKVEMGQQEEEEQEEDMFDDSEIFGEALEELGDEFLTQLENIDNIEF